MRRRKFIAAFAGAVAWPLIATAQPRQIRRVALLAGNSSAGSGKTLVDCLVNGLHELGWIEGQNLKTDIRWTEGLSDRYASLAAELVESGPDLIVVSSTPGTQAVQRATRNIPVVFVGVSDPVSSGIVASLPRPGGNITGVSNFLPATSGKLIELLKSAAPRTRQICVLHNPGNAGKLLELGELQTAGRTLGVDVAPVEVRSTSDFEGAFSKIMQANCQGLIALQEGVTLSGRSAIAEFALAHRLPAAFQIREFVEVGGLLSYGLNYCDHYRRGAAYVDKILKGARPAELPVELPTTYQLVINLKTARAFGLEISPTLLATADEVIE